MSSKYYFILVRCGTLFATLVSLLCGLGMIGSSPAEAAATSCSFSSTGIAFPSYSNVSQSAVDGVGTITITCTGSGTASLSLNINGGNGGTCTNRQLRNGTANLGYAIFADSARTANWCDGVSRLDTTIDFSTGSTQSRSYTMYARVSAAQNVPFGSYTDTLNFQLKQGGGVIVSGTIHANSTVSPECLISAGTLGFGTYNQSAATLGTGTVQVNCPTGASYEIALGTGSNFSANRRMAGPSANFLDYRLYADSARSLLWGDGVTLGPRVSGTGNGSTQSISVYGSIPAGQNKVIGNYSDTVVVTLSY